MNYTALTLAQTPPLSVPLRYFITAPLFTLLAGMIALWYGPELFSSRWNPALLAATHALTLGFLASAMVGAIQQLLPVLAGSPLPRPRLVSGWVHLLLTFGTLLLIGGWLLGSAVLFQAAAVALLLALIPFLMIVLLALWRSSSRHPSILTMALAVVGLAITVGLGVELLLGYAWPDYAIHRTLTDSHMGWGLVGTVAVLIGGVAYQVVPMFQITPNYPRWLMRSYAPLLLLVVAAWSLSGAAWLTVVGALLLASFALTTLWLQYHRRRRIADVTLDFWRMAMVSLLLALLLWLAGSQLGTPALLPVVLMIAGFAISAVNGMLYKIAPFLIWLHLNNRMQALGRWQGKIPNMKQIIPERQARLQFRLQLAALLLLLGATLQPEWLLRPAALLWIVSAGWLLKNLLVALYLFRRIVSEQGDVG